MTTDELKKQGRGGGIVTFDFQSFAGAYIEDLRRTLSEMPIEELEKLHREVVSAIRNDATIHFIGNGGSAATPSHLSLIHI